MAAFPPEHNEIPCITTNHVFSLDTAANCLDEFETERLREAAGDRVLSFREIGAISLKSVRPNVGASLGVDQLDIDADLVAGAPHAAFDDISNAKIPSDLLHVGGFAFIGERGIAGDHKAIRNPREIRRQIIGDRVGEVFLLRIIRQVHKRQDDD